MTTLKRILTALVLLILGPSVVRACTCAGGGIFNVNRGCDRGWNAGRVTFLGKVTAKVDLGTPDDSGAPDLSAGYAVHFSVSERFDGGSDLGEIVVYTGSGGGDCGYPFVVGTSYLVYASGREDHLSTSICTRTSPDVLVGGVLQQLRALRDKGHGDEMFGSVATWPTGLGIGDIADSKALVGVSVQVTGSHGTLFSSKTDEHGAFAFAALPPDTYNIVYDVPQGYRVPSLKTGNTFLVKLDAPDGSGIGCSLNAFPMPDGQVSGEVVDLRGERVAGSVNLEPVDMEQASANGRRVIIPGDEFPDGKFLLQLLRPGHYKLAFVPKLGGRYTHYQRFYWPPNSDAIDLGLGQHIDNIRFEVPLTGSEQSPAPK